MARALPQPSYGISPRVVIVDDHPTFRHAARMLLAARGYDVVGEACCAASALDAVKRHAPEAVLLDVCLGDDDGFEVCGLLTRSRPELAVLLASVDEQDSERITRCGARGFVRKSRLLQIDFGEFWPRNDPDGVAPDPSRRRHRRRTERR
jgi:DNA-binding NarL/FixJ family response regulator